MLECLGKMIVASLLISMPLLYNMGMRTRKVERFTCIDVFIDAAETKSPFVGGNVVGRSMLMLKGGAPAMCSLLVSVAMVVGVAGGN